MREQIRKESSAHDIRTSHWDMNRITNKCLTLFLILELFLFVCFPALNNNLLNMHLYKFSLLSRSIFAPSVGGTCEL